MTEKSHDGTYTYSNEGNAIVSQKDMFSSVQNHTIKLNEVHNPVE